MNINYEKRIFGLDLMRATAILLVVFSHTTYFNNYQPGNLTDLLSMAGLMGVEIFFVLSGFLIGGILYKLFVVEDINRKNLIYFWIRRWFRTLPNYYLILLINIFFALIIGYNLPESTARYFFFLQNFKHSMPWFFPESWSLPIEEFAYLLGPALLYGLFCFKLRIDKSLLYLLITLGIILFFIGTKIIYHFHHLETDMMFWNINVKAMTIYRIDAIYYGVLASWLFSKYPYRWKLFRWHFLVLGMFLLLIIVFVLPILGVLIEYYPLYWNVFYLPLISVAIGCMLPLINSIKTANKYVLKPFTFISIISYSMYLIHLSIVLNLIIYINPILGAGYSQVIFWTVLYFILTFIISYILFRYWEKPMMDIREHPLILKRIGVSSQDASIKGK